MATPEEATGAVTQALHELAGEGREWVEVDDIARQALMRSGEHLGRRRFINSLSDIFLGGRRWGDKKLLPKYRALTEEVILCLEDESVIMHQSVENGNQTAETSSVPPGPNSYLYRLVQPPQAAS